MEDIAENCLMCRMIDDQLDGPMFMKLPTDIIAMIKDMTSYTVEHTVNLRDSRGDIDQYVTEEYVPNWGDYMQAHDCSWTGYDVSKEEKLTHFVQIYD